MAQGCAFNVGRPRNASERSQPRSQKYAEDVRGNFIALEPVATARPSRVFSGDIML